MTDQHYIPSSSEVTGGSGSSPWRPSEGKIVRGAGKPSDAQWSGEIASELIGKIVAIYDYPAQKTHHVSGEKFQPKDAKGRPIWRIRVDLETASGPESFAVSTSTLVSASTFTDALRMTGENGVISIQTKAGQAGVDENGNSTSPPTYVNIAEVKGLGPNGGAPYKRFPIKPPRAVNEGRFDAWEHLARARNMLRSHPNFKGNPYDQPAPDNEIPDAAAVTGDATPMDAFAAVVRGLGRWPLLDADMADAYLAWFNALAPSLDEDGGYGTLDQVPVRVIEHASARALDPNGSVPKTLREAHEKLHPAPAATPYDDYDPFADN